MNNENTRPTMPLKLQALLLALTVALLALSAPASAGAQAGAGVGCTDTSADAVASGNAGVTGTATMKGPTSDHGFEGMPGIYSDYYHVWAEGSGGSTATAHGEDTQGNTATAKCDYTLPSSPPPPPQPGEDPCADFPNPSKPTGTTVNCAKRYIQGIRVDSDPKDCEDKCLVPIILNMVLGIIEDAGDETLIALDPVSGLYTAAEGGIISLGDPSDFATLPAGTSVQTLPIGLQYSVTQSGHSVVASASLGPL